MTNPTPWKYVNTLAVRTADPTRNVVFRTYPDGRMESCAPTREDVVAWVDAGNEIEAAEGEP